MKPRMSSRLLQSIVFSSLPLASSAFGQTWVPATGAGVAWNDDANWSAVPFPDAIGASASLNNNITGNVSINLNEDIILGSMILGDSTPTTAGSNNFNTFTINTGTPGGSLIFDVTGTGTATLTRQQVGTNSTTYNNTVDVINASVVLNDNLKVDIGPNNFNGGITFQTGVISGAGGIIRSATASTGANSFLRLYNTSNTYTGDTVVENGILAFRGSVLSGQTSALGQSANALILGNANTTNALTLQLEATSDTDNYEISRAMDFSGSTLNTGRSRLQFNANGADSPNTNTLVLSNTITLSGGARATELFVQRAGMTINITGNIVTPTTTPASTGSLILNSINPPATTTATDGASGGTVRFSNLSRSFTNPISLTTGRLVIDGVVTSNTASNASAPAVIAAAASPIGTQAISLADGAGGNLINLRAEGATRAIFLESAGSSYGRVLAPGGAVGTNLATTGTINGVTLAQIQARYGNSGSFNLNNGYLFGGLNTTGTTTFSGAITPANVNVAVTGSAAGAGGSNVITTAHNIALIAQTGGTVEFTGIISGSNAPTLGSSTPGATSAANNTRITINQFRNHANLDANLDGNADSGGAVGTNANELIGTATGGTVILTNANTYSGGTEVLGGKLLVNNTTNSGTGTGAVTVASGATLGGTGSMSGALNVTGVLAPGASIETLDSGALTLNNGSTFAYEVDSSVSTALGADLQKVTGNLTLLGTVNLTLGDLASSNTAFADGTIFSLINYTGAWNNGLFTLGGNELTNNEEFSWGSNTWKIAYDAADGGVNFSGEYLGGSDSFVNLTAIPEPASAVLGGLGCLLLLRRRKA